MAHLFKHTRKQNEVSGSFVKIRTSTNKTNRTRKQYTKQDFNVLPWFHQLLTVILLARCYTE
jgi:hypothetical protein